jgi:hypothetical protein
VGHGDYSRICAARGINDLALTVCHLLEPIPNISRICKDKIWILETDIGKFLADIPSCPFFFWHNVTLSVTLY